MGIVRPIVQECFIPEQYTSSPEIIKNCLKDVLNEGIINSQVSALVENEDMTKKQKETIIKKHMEQYTTKYYESDNRWHSFLPDESHPRKMKPIAKRKWEDLEKVILEFYQAQEESEKRKQITLRTFYPEWFAYKWQDTNNSSYMHKIASDWKRFYEDDPIVDRPILELTTLELKTWARNKIISCNLSKKIYYNMAVIIRQSLDYLVELGELPSNPYSNFKIKASLFTPVVEKEPEYKVFSEVEEQQIKEYALKDFERNTELTTALAVVLNFSLGLRVGELVALKWKDLKNSYLHIRHTEQKQYKEDAMRFSGHKDIQTYIKHYCFSRYSDKQKRNELEKTLNV